MTAVADARTHCHDVSPIVGRSRCHAYGYGWVHDPYNAIEFGLTTSSFVVDRIVLPDVHDTNRIYDPSGRLVDYHVSLLGRRFTAYGYRTGLSLHTAHASLGLELAVLGGVGPLFRTEVDGMSLVQDADAFAVEGGLAGGVHARRGAVDAGVELAPAFHSVVLSPPFPDRYSLCLPNVPHCGPPGESASMTVVEVRARVDWWVSRQVTFGLVGGVDLVRHGGSVALAFRFHPSAYDGG